MSRCQLKAIVIDDKLEICHHVSINYDVDLAEFGTKGGVIRDTSEPNVVTAPVLMWLKALDTCLDRLKLENVNFTSIVCISGCAQQHGTVWWRTGAGKVLEGMDSSKCLHEILESSFSLEHSPTWLDSSTSAECKSIEDFLGGSKPLAEICGCPAFERFAGPQISKVFRRKNKLYKCTERITLISNFLSSVMAGSFTPFDASDAAGTNMMDIRFKSWSDVCLKAVVGDDEEVVGGLKARLGWSDSIQGIVDSDTLIGRISPYFVERYNFSPNCLLSSFPGDTPSSMAGLAVAKGDLVVSLGTSDTAIFLLDEPISIPNVHLSRSPMNPTQYAGMTGSKNGSRTRERIRDECSAGDWNRFADLLSLSPVGNSGNIGFFLDLCEIYPFCQGNYRFDSYDRPVLKFAPEIEIRACLEGQFMRLYHHLGVITQQIDRLYVTGGASMNRAILQVLADVFQKPVFVSNIPDSACLGAAYLAKYAFAKSVCSGSETTNYDEVISRHLRSHLTSSTPLIEPRRCESGVYQKLLNRYIKLEDSLNSMGRSPSSESLQRAQDLSNDCHIKHRRPFNDEKLNSDQLNV